LLARWQNVQAFESQDTERRFTFTWGGEGRHEEGESLDRVFKGERGVIAGFAHAETQLGPWEGIASVRVDHYDDFGARPVFHLGGAFRIAPTVKLRASGGTGFRVPSFNERLFPFFGNPQLRPEEGASGDAGLDWTLSAGTRLSLTGFYSRFDDLIQLSFEPRMGPLIGNIPHTRLAGAELEWETDWGDGLTSGIGYTYTYTDAEDRDSGKELPYHPRHTGRAWSQWRLSPLPLTLRAEADYRGAGWHDRANTLRLEDAVRLNLLASYQVLESMAVYLRVENLTDNRTPELFSLASSGTAVYGGVRIGL